MEVESPTKLTNGSNGSTPVRPGAKRTHTGELAKSAQSPISPTSYPHSSLLLISQVLRVSFSVSQSDESN